MNGYQYTKTELNKILKTLVIIVDTREQKNEHILKSFREKQKVPYEVETLKTGDYACKIPKNEEYGILRDIYIPARVERKAHVDEIIGNILRDKRTAFENELIRSKDIPFTLICEDKDGYEKIVRQEYRSEMSPLAVIGTLNSFKARYNFEIVYLEAKLSANFIYYHLYYQALNWLKQN